MTLPKLMNVFAVLLNSCRGMDHDQLRALSSLRGREVYNFQSDYERATINPTDIRLPDVGYNFLYKA